MKILTILALVLFISIGLIESFKNPKKSSNFNWSLKGAVRPVGDESEINNFAEWTLAMTAALESTVFTTQITKRLVKFSDQQVEDCTANAVFDLIIDEINQNTPNLSVAFEKILQYWNKNGIQDNKTYPFDPYGDKECKYYPNKYYKKLKIEPTCLSLSDSEEGLEESIKIRLKEYGPAAVGIMTNDEFVPYDGSNIYTCTVKPHQIRYLLLVGYGSEEKGGKVEKYWIARGFYDKSWGEGGYIKISMDTSNNCGILGNNTCFVDVSKD